MALAVAPFLIALGAVLLVGWLGSLLFAKTKVPDVLLLMGFGVLLGYIGRTNDVDLSGLDRAAPFIGAIALITILFDGGLKLKFADLLRGAGRATALAVLGFLLTAALVGGYVAAVLDRPFLHGVLLGSILGGTSSVIVMPIVDKMGLRRQTATVLGLESAITDVLVVVIAITLAGALAGTVQASPLGLDNNTTAANGGGGAGALSPGIGRDIVGSLALALVVGAALGLAWLKALQWLSGALEYMMTLAALFFLYGFVELLEASGAIAVFAFAIVLGNAYKFSEKMNLETTGVTHVIARMQEEITFFVRTFFFVYLGLVLDLSVLTTGFLLVAAGLVLVLAGARWLAVRASVLGSRSLREDSLTMTIMMPRGLAAAVLAAMPFAQFNLPGTRVFVDYTFAVIVLTNIVATVGVFWLSRRGAAAGAPASGE